MAIRGQRETKRYHMTNWSTIVKSICNVSSRKHTYIILIPLNPTSIGIHIFLISAKKT